MENIRIPEREQFVADTASNTDGDLDEAYAAAYDLYHTIERSVDNWPFDDSQETFDEFLTWLYQQEAAYEPSLDIQVLLDGFNNLCKACGGTGYY